MDIFSEINVFKIGVIKPEKNGSSAFLPVFPFFYKMLDHGDKIMEGKHKISLLLAPEFRRKIK